MIINIIQTPQGYRATVDGTEWSIPDAPGNRHWQMVQDAIAEGAAVTIEQPPKAPVPASISFAQLLIGLVSEGWITAAEGRAWRDRVALPAQVQAVIASLPVEQQFAAETRALAPSEVLRNDPLVLALSFAANKTIEELDDFFYTYSEV